MIVFVLGVAVNGSWDAQLARATPMDTRLKSVTERMIGGYVWSASLSGIKDKKIDIEDEAKLISMVRA